MSWRVGSKVNINVYDGDRPVCQCHNAEDAATIVRMVNSPNALRDLLDNQVHRAEEAEALCREFAKVVRDGCGPPHRKGCLYLERPDMPCQCGGVQRINDVINRGRRLLAAHPELLHSEEATQDSK